ncbi:MAG TPA: hypothetical protein VL443_10910 [Cyclobacteriaceae bacterium]|nr:hypothetical protein [Cyclobacteriaceae bacterium]
MKRKIAITFAFLFGISAMVKSQSISGLYETSQASIDQKMMYASEDLTTMNESSNSSYITKDSNNPSYRLVGNTRYLILNPSGQTHLYQLEALPSENQPATTQYYFSRGTGEVQKLTLINIKNAFAGDLDFHESLDAEFKSDEELASYESLPRLAALLEIFEENSLLVTGDAR